MSLEELTPIQTRIFEELAKGISLTRRDFVKTLGRARTTIYDNLEILEKRKLIKRFKKHNGLKGRPLTLWFIPKNLLHELFKDIANSDKKPKN
jgi:predicted transcriptional regulator